jgi:hypothetical protein
MTRRALVGAGVSSDGSNDISEREQANAVAFGGIKLLLACAVIGAALALILRALAPA